MGETRQIFRAKAIRRHNDRREENVLPLFGAPRAARTAWILLGLFCGALFVAARTEVPAYVHGAVALDDGPHAQGALTAILLPPESLPKLKVGQEAFIELHAGAVVSGTVVEVAGLRPLAETGGSPGRAGGGGETARPVAVAFARFGWGADPASSRASAAERPARVAVGSRHLVALPGAD